MPFPGYTGWVVTIDDVLIADDDSVVLDINNPQVSGIAIGAAGGGAILDWGTAQITEYLAQQGKYGSSVADFVIPNRVITIPLGVGMDIGGETDPETALQNLREKVGKLQREGGWLRRQRGTGTPNLYADIVNATLVVPDNWMETAGVETNITLTLECIPDFYGDEAELNTITCSGYCTGVVSAGGVAPLFLPVTNIIEGDYPARCRLEVIGGSSNQQYSLVYGFRSRYFDPSATAQLFYPSTALNGGFASTRASVAGSYSSTVLQLSATTSSAGVVTFSMASGDLNLTHVGTYRVWCRASTSAAVSINMAWSQGVQDSVNWAVNPAQTFSASSSWTFVDLGIIRIDPAVYDPHEWSGGIFAQTASGTATVNIDAVWFQPLDETAGVMQLTDSSDYTAIVNPTHSPPNSTFVGTSGVYVTSLLSLIGSYVPLSPLVGDLPRIPPSGMEGRFCQIFMKICVGGLAAPGPLDTSIDAFSVVPYYRPCYLQRV